MAVPMTALSPLKALEEKWRERGKSYRQFKDTERNKDFEAAANLHADDLSAVRETVEQEMAVQLAERERQIDVLRDMHKANALEIQSLRAQLAARDAEIAQLSAGKEVMREASLAECAAKVTAEAEVERLKLTVAKIAATILAAPLSHNPDAKYTLAVQYAHTAVPEWPDIAKETAINVPKATLTPSTHETREGQTTEGKD